MTTPRESTLLANLAHSKPGLGESTLLANLAHSKPGLGESTLLANLIKYPICADPNYNKSIYHVYMSTKIMVNAELLIFSYDIPEFIKNLNELFRFILQCPNVVLEFPTFTPIIINAIKYIRTNPIMFSEQTDAFQLTRKLMDVHPQLIYTIE